MGRYNREAHWHGACGCRGHTQPTGKFDTQFLLGGSCLALWMLLSSTQHSIICVWSFEDEITWISCNSLLALHFFQNVLSCVPSMRRHIEVHCVFLWFQQATQATFLPAVPRIVAIGDLHGDMGKARRAFRLGGLIDENDHWVGGTTTAVQVGSRPPISHLPRG